MMMEHTFKYIPFNYTSRKKRRYLTTTVVALFVLVSPKSSKKKRATRNLNLFKAFRSFGVSKVGTKLLVLQSDSL